MFFAPLEVDLGDTTEQFFCQFIGTKGDWPFLRASYQLQSGFSSLRVCHLCDGQDLGCTNIFYFASFLLVQFRIDLYGILQQYSWNKPYMQEWYDLGPSG